MNKVLVGIMVVLVGGVVGWYMFRGGAKLPGMQIAPNAVVTPAAGEQNGNVIITEESAVVGSGKGGVMTQGEVSYTDTGYTPATLTVKKGTKVTFRNDSSSGMWTASGVHPTHQLLPGFDQLKSVAKGGVYEYTFAKVGTWKYHNHVKPTDGGTVIVTE
ncbi:cupredoxin domain-containing protein [Candidatus Gottesmanbacteria bacterium]|nr:cupredoxin domain-containing protein [Candidatus Gottesmanbacteria bacterium]